MDILEEQEKAYNYIKNTIANNNKISHAYLIETNGYENTDIFVKKMIKMILSVNKTEEEQQQIEKQVDTNSYIDLKVIEPDGYWIKKEQLLDLEQEFAKKSVLDNKLIYVITDAEKLNDSSANTMLKFLEEPVDDIVAILIANNRYKVIDTILSRCQIISLISKNNIIKLEDEIIEFAKSIDSSKKLMVNFNNYYDNLFSDKNMAIDSMNKLENLFFRYLNNEIESIDGKIYQKEKVTKILIVLNKQKEKLIYNVNYKLWLHETIIELLEVK